jgi:hypothetical protein
MELVCQIFLMYLSSDDHPEDNLIKSAYKLNTKVLKIYATFYVVCLLATLLELSSLESVKKNKILNLNFTSQNTKSTFLTILKRNPPAGEILRQKTAYPRSIISSNASCIPAFPPVFMYSDVQCTKGAASIHLRRIMNGMLLQNVIQSTDDEFP